MTNWKDPNGEQIPNWGTAGAIIAKEGGVEVRERKADGTLGAPMVYRATEPVLSVWKFVLVYPVLRESNPISFVASAKENDLLAAAINWLKTLSLPSSVALPRFYSYRRLPDGSWLSQFGVTCFNVTPAGITRVSCPPIQTR